MDIKLKTGTTFEKRLVEIAWEHAEDLTKTTVANTLALALAVQKQKKGSGDGHSRLAHRLVVCI
jgi:hypothetical protein